MPRKPIGEKPMTETVKFRLSADELSCLRDMAEDENISIVLRALIQQECRGRFSSTTSE